MGDGDPTELAPTETNTESVQASGLDEYDDPPTIRLTAGRITAAAVTASLIAVAVAGVLAWQRLRGEDAPVDAAVTSSMVPATTLAAPVTTVVVAAPPPPPVTITTVIEKVPQPTTGWAPSSVTPTGMSPGVVAEYDRQFLTKLKADGWTITNPAAMVNNAHIVCVAFQRHVPPQDVNDELMTKAGMSTTEALMFSTSAMLIYPDCP